MHNPCHTTCVRFELSSWARNATSYTKRSQLCCRAGEDPSSYPSFRNGNQFNNSNMGLSPSSSQLQRFFWAWFSPRQCFPLSPLKTRFKHTQVTTTAKPTSGFFFQTRAISPRLGSRVFRVTTSGSRYHLTMEFRSI